MKNVTCYHFADMLDNRPSLKEAGLQVFGTDTKLVVIEGPKGVLVVENDACYYKLGSVGRDFQVDLGKVPEVKVDENGKERKQISLMPSASITRPLKDYLDDCREKGCTTEGPLTGFVRRFGGRIENNYSVLLDSIEEIGLNPKDYPRDEQEVA